jgi:hypothetical protein
MSEENPFDDLAPDSPDATDDSGRQPKSQQKETVSKTVEQTETTDPEPASSSVTRTEGPSLEDSSPPFSYKDAEQNQLYTQTGLWDDFEDLKFDAEMILRKEHDVRNVEQRELDTAVLAEVLNRITVSDIAERVIHRRGFVPDE